MSDTVQLRLRDGTVVTKQRASLPRITQALGYTPDVVDGDAPPGEPGLPPLPGVPEPQIGKLRSAWEGARQGLTFGLSDEASGLVHAGLEKLAGDPDVDPSLRPSFIEAYRHGRDADRAFDAASKAANPKSHLLGDLAGNTVTSIAGGGVLGRLVPGAVKAVQGIRASQPIVNAAARAAVSGGIQGSINGLGRSDAVSTMENLADAGLGGVVGAGIGAVTGAAGKAIPAAVKKRLADAAAKADKLRVLTAAADTGGSIATPPVLREIERVPGGVAEAARVMRANDLAPRISTAQGMLERSTGQNDKANAVISAIIDGVDEARPAAGQELEGAKHGLWRAIAQAELRPKDVVNAGVQSAVPGGAVNVRNFAGLLERHADSLARQPEMDSVADALRARASQYAGRFPAGASMREAQALKTQLGDRVNYTQAANGNPIPNGQLAAKIAAKAMSDEMDAAAAKAFGVRGLPPEIAEAGADIAKRVGSGPGIQPTGNGALDAYRAARRLSQVSGVLKDAAEDSVARGAAKARVGLLAKTSAPMGAAVGGALGGPMGAAAGSWLAPELSASIRPFAASARASTAELAREALASPRVQRALDEGGPALVAAVRAYLNTRKPK